MKFGRIAAPGTLRLEEAEAPRAGPGEVVVELAACGICGTDLEKLRGNYQSAGKIGHEPVGRVVEVGPGVSAVGVGTRVSVHHHVPCYACPVCERGDYTFCPSYSRTNLEPGGFAERFVVPAENVARGALLPLDPAVPWTVGALYEPAGCALTAARRVGLGRGSSVFVVGLGPVGALYGRVARALGASWVGGADLSEPRRRRAGARGFDGVLDAADPEAIQTAVRGATAGHGVDVAVVATGASAAIRLGYSLARRGGTLNLFGLPEPGGRLDVDLQELYLRGVRVVPTYATTEPDLAEIQALVTTGRLDLTGLVSHARPLEQLAQAFELARDTGRSLKVLVTGPAAEARDFPDEG